MEVSLADWVEGSEWTVTRILQVGRVFIHKAPAKLINDDPWHEHIIVAGKEALDLYLYLDPVQSRHPVGQAM